MNRTTKRLILLSLVAIVLVAGATWQFISKAALFHKELYREAKVMKGDIIDMGIESSIPLNGKPATALTVELPSADGKVVFDNDSASIDASNAQDGYVMIKHVGQSEARLKVMITGPSGTAYTYNLNQNGTYEVFPLSDGSGSYKIGVYKNISDTKYSTLFSQTTDVQLSNEFTPFLRPNQYVNYTASSAVVSKAAELTQNTQTDIEKVEEVYNFVVTTLTYDQDKAKQVIEGSLNGYLPDVDQILRSQKGICFDYAAMMTAMLRSVNVPTKLVVGYAGSVYHAWISTYSEETGWVEGIIFFDGKQWKLMDPTFASSGNQSDTIMEYIGNGSNYSAKYLY